MTLKSDGQRQLSYDSEKRLLKVVLPIRFSRRGGRTHILTPDGQPLVAPSKTTPPSPLRELLVRSHQWHEWLDKGKFRTVKEIAEKEGIKNKNYPYFIMSLYSLAPGIQEIILTGEGLDRLRSVKDIRQVELPDEWELQEGVVFRALGE